MPTAAQQVFHAGKDCPGIEHAVTGPLAGSAARIGLLPAADPR